MIMDESLSIIPAICSKGPLCLATETEYENLDALKTLVDIFYSIQLGNSIIKKKKDGLLRQSIPGTLIDV